MIEFDETHSIGLIHNNTFNPDMFDNGNGVPPDYMDLIGGGFGHGYGNMHGNGFCNEYDSFSGDGIGVDFYMLKQNRGY